MSETFPWLQFCMNHFEVTNVGANHDLMELFKEEIDEPELLYFLTIKYLVICCLSPPNSNLSLSIIIALS